MTTLTPIQLPPDALLALHAANPQRYPVLLESAAQGAPLGQFDILLACPGARLTLNADGSLSTDATIDLASGFLESLDSWWRQERIEAQALEVPFVGGWFLFLGYELAREIEPKVNVVTQHSVRPVTAMDGGNTGNAGAVLSNLVEGLLQAKPPRSTQRDETIIAQAIRIPAAVIIRHSDDAAWIVEEEGSRLTSQIETDIGALNNAQRTSSRLLMGELQEEPASRYLECVRAALEHIAAGDIYQANLSRRWNGKLADGVAAHDVYRCLRQANPAPFAALAVLEELAIASSSPERLVEVRNGIASTRPIAGTRPRHTDRSDDAVRRLELHSHPKERAEHVMLIDLERNDLGRVCEVGTVEVNEFMTVESYAHVHHIVSNVRGRLRATVSPGQAIAAVFPGGTITGCPKVRCMEIIAKLERAPRGAYTGSLGYLNRDGSMDLNILIRTIEIRGDEIYFRAGAGLVADSVPEQELDETRAKARGLIEALEIEIRKGVRG
jgi:anthranilate synthase component 1